MADPIKQALEDYRDPLATDEDRAAARPIVEQAILRYHPDVVRLVEAARRANLPEHEYAYYRDGFKCRYCGRHECADASLNAALVPFKEVQE